MRAREYGQDSKQVVLAESMTNVHVDIAAILPELKSGEDSKHRPAAAVFIGSVMDESLKWGCVVASLNQQGCIML